MIVRLIEKKIAKIIRTIMFERRKYPCIIPDAERNAFWVSYCHKKARFRCSPHLKPDAINYLERKINLNIIQIQRGLSLPNLYQKTAKRTPIYAS